MFKNGINTRIELYNLSSVYFVLPRMDSNHNSYVQSVVAYH